MALIIAQALKNQEGSMNHEAQRTKDDKQRTENNFCVPDEKRTDPTIRKIKGLEEKTK